MFCINTVLPDFGLETTARWSLANRRDQIDQPAIIFSGPSYRVQ